MAAQVLERLHRWGQQRTDSTPDRLNRGKLLLRGRLVCASGTTPQPAPSGDDDVCPSTPGAENRGPRIAPNGRRGPGRVAAGPVWDRTHEAT